MIRKFFLAACLVAAPTTADVSQYDIMWDLPSADSSGSMPLGNGVVTLNVWTEPSGDVCFYIARGDAISSINRPLKLGRVRLTLDPAPDPSVMTQALRLADGTIEVTCGEGDDARKVTVWIEHDRHIVHVEAEGGRDFAVTAAVELWRDRERTLSGNETLSALEVDERKWEGPDTVVPTDGQSVAWYHRNAWSWFENNLTKQNLGGMIGRIDDPLKHRTFGGVMLGEGFTAAGDLTLKSGPSTRHALAIVTHRSQPESGDAWLAEAREKADTLGDVSRDDARRALREHLDAFWGRSFIHVRTPEDLAVGANRLRGNNQPLRIGARHDGGHTFRGELRRLKITGRDGTIVEWHFDDIRDDYEPVAGNYEPVAGNPQLVARVVGEVTAGGHGGIRLGEDAWLEVVHHPDLRFEDTFTLEVEARIDAEGGGGAIVCKGENRGDQVVLTIPAEHAVTGHLVSRDVPNVTTTIANRTLHSATRFPADRWMTVKVEYDADTGVQRTWQDGHLLGESPEAYRPDLVAQLWHLQRMMFAGAGRTEFPLKFNGLGYTFDSAAYNADYRRWGGSYWFQNTRLMYWPMLASGDYDLMLPFFDMFRNSLELARHRTQTYFNHDGAFWPETITQWGSIKEGDYSPDPEFGHIRSPWIRYYYSGNLELVAMMLDYWDHTRDATFLNDTLLPVATDVIAFYHHRIGRDQDGRMLFDPSQALETYQQARNPANEIAGLLYVLPLLVDLPDDAVDTDTRKFWRETLAIVPPLPRRTLDDGRETLAAVEKAYADRRNSENPELYGVFPFRLFGVGRDELDVARTTFARRVNQSAWSWQQNDVQAALLGLTDEAAGMVLARARGSHYRFPAFWQHGNDWAPDGCHAGNFMLGLQAMLLQEVDGDILLLPAWPADWDVHFKLHASGNTTVEARVEGGKVKELIVAPETHRHRVRVMN